MSTVPRGRQRLSSVCRAQKTRATARRATRMGRSRIPFPGWRGIRENRAVERRAGGPCHRFRRTRSTIRPEKPSAGDWRPTPSVSGSVRYVSDGAPDGLAARDPRRHATSDAAPARRSVTTTIAGIGRFARLAGVGEAAGALAASNASSISTRASAMSWIRVRGSFCRQRRTSRCTSGGSAGGSAVQSGSRSRIAAIVSESSPRARVSRSAVHRARSRTPRHRYACRPPGRAPARDSYTRQCRGSRRRASDWHPRLSAARRPRWIAVGVAFARPKSSSFTVPSDVIFTLLGLRSRWTTPLP